MEHAKNWPTFLRNLQTSLANNSRIFRIKNAKFSGYCFYINTNVQRDFQICISVPLMSIGLPYPIWLGRKKLRAIAEITPK